MQPEIFDNETSDDSRQISPPVIAEEGIETKQDPISLDIPDDELYKVVDKNIEDDKKFWISKYNLTERRKKMELALFGREIQEKEKRSELKAYEARFSENAIYEIEATLKPVAMSHMPDLIVSPGNDTPEAQQSAEDISTAVNDDIKKRSNRKVLGMGFKHLPVYLTGIIKIRWNPEIDDYEYYNPLPENVVIDRRATSNDADKMMQISELVTMTVQEAVMRFPDKKDKLFEKLKSQGLATGEGGFNWKDLASEIKVWEVWFTWFKKSDEYDADGSPLEEPGNKWEKVEGLLWKYEDIILKKMKNPNFDYEGATQYFTYDDPSQEKSKRPFNEREVLQTLLTGQMPQNTQQEQVYFNYFKFPRKPYFFMGYDQWGKVAIDETSRIEQNLYSQQNLDTQGKQIIDTLKARVKHIWSTDSGLDAGDVQNMDMENPKLDALVDGNINEVHASVTPERPDASQFEAKKMAKDEMFSLAGATSLTGVVQSDVATNNQIAREQNFTRADDLVEDTINAASEWMAQWALQMIKLRYTEEHFRKLLGAKGTFTFLKLKRDQIDDGMEVMIKSSGTDKLKAQKNATEAAQLGAPYTNPIDFFRDMDSDDPEGRAERGMMMLLDPNGYMAKYIMGLDTQGMANQLNAPQPLPAGGAPQQPQQPVAPPQMNPTPTDTTAVPTQQPQFPQGSPRGI